MKILILSTPTKHHTYFINKIAELHNICGIIYERKVLKKDYPTGPFYSDLENKYEDKFFEDGTPNDLSDELKKKIVEVYSVNNKNLQFLMLLSGEQLIFIEDRLISIED